MKVFLHIGLHKTASTSIQFTLGNAFNVLLNEGYLFPVFMEDNQKLFNHSVPLKQICSLEFKDKETADKMVLLSEQNRNTQARLFYDQLIGQINKNEFKNLIISGEALSNWNIEYLSKLRDLLKILFRQHIEITVIIYIRHPITWIQSMVAQQVIDGVYTLEEAIDNAHKTLNNKWRHTIERIKSVFPDALILVNRIEDVKKYQNGITEHFLSLLQTKPDIVEKIKHYYVNESQSLLTIKIISEINRVYSYKIRKNLDYKLVMNIPGEKLILPENMVKSLWKDSLEDQKWLYENYGVEPYNHLKKSRNSNTIRINQKSIEHVIRSLPSMSTEVKTSALKVIQQEEVFNKKN